MAQVRAAAVFCSLPDGIIDQVGITLAMIPQGRMKIEPRVAIAVALLSILASYAVFLLPELARALAAEDRFFEVGTAICFFLAALILGSTWLKRSGPNDFFVFETKRNLFLLLLALLFLFGAGEEISWGQRLLGIEVPEAIRDRNVQGELNIHNLEVFNRTEDGEPKTGVALLFSIERMFSLFWLSYCFLVPLLGRFWPVFSGFLGRINLPLVPLWLGVFFPLNYLVAKSVEKLLLVAGKPLAWQVSEVKEFLFSLLFLIMALWFRRDAGTHGAARP